MPTESFPIAPTVLSVPLHSYGMLAYQLETSGLRRSEVAVFLELSRAKIFARKTATCLAFSNHSNVKFEI